MPSSRDTSSQSGPCKHRLVQSSPSSSPLTAHCSENALSAATLPVPSVPMATNSRESFAKLLAEPMRFLALMVNASALELTKTVNVLLSAHLASTRRPSKEPMKFSSLLNILRMVRMPSQSFSPTL